MNNISKKLKEIREKNNLTQKAFAKKFYVTEKTISNYEHERRSPDLYFLTKVCQEFNLPFDTFVESERKPSLFQDLTMVGNNGKYGIFDKKQCKYLAPTIYNHILLSQSGYHIVCKWKKPMTLIEYAKLADETNEQTTTLGTTIKNIDYTAIVDNSSNFTEIPNLILGLNNGFSRENRCIAYNKSDKKFYLVDEKGNFKSKGYDDLDILNFDLVHMCYKAMSINGLQKNYTIIDKDGNTLDIKLKLSSDMRRISLDDSQYENGNIFKYLREYGMCIMRLIDNSFFSDKINYPYIVDAVNDYCTNHPQYYVDFPAFIKWLVEKSEICDKEKKTIENNLPEISIENNIYKFTKILVKDDMVTLPKISEKNRIDRQFIENIIANFYTTLGFQIDKKTH